jgi:hypothetical protein
VVPHPFSCYAEDEAVVAQLLRANKDTLELIDAREFIPHFNCRPGLTDWLVLDDSQVKRREKPVNKKGNETVAVAEENGEESNGANKADGESLSLATHVTHCPCRLRTGSC